MEKNPRTVTEFRRLLSKVGVKVNGKKRLGGRTAEEAKKLHDKRLDTRRREKQPISVGRFRKLSFGETATAQSVNGAVLIPLGSHEIKHTAHMAAKRWTSQKSCFGASHVQTYDQGKYSNRCTYHRIDYCQFVTSFGIVANGHLFTWIDEGGKIQRKHFFPWRGWKISFLRW
jgi:hypothetical protein